MGLPFAVLLVLMGVGDRPEQAAPKDLDWFQGDWVVVSMVRDGQRVPDGDAQCTFRTVKGNAYTVFFYDKPIGKGTFTIDPAKSPKTTDFHPPAGKPILGIYRIEGDRYSVCYGLPGTLRPTDFTSKAGSGRILAVWERERKR